MSRLPSGVHPILYALFDAEGQLDRAAMRRQVEICLEQGAVGIATLGLATEVRHLTAAERRRVIEWNAEDIGGRVPLGVTIFAPTAEEQIEVVDHAAAAGAGWVVLQPPAAATDERSLADGFSRVLERSALPAALQNMPQFLGVGLSVRAITELGDKHANLIGVKQEVAATETAELVASVGDGLQIFSGRGGLELVDCMRAGISGHIPAPEYADRLIDIWRLMEAGDEAAARDLYARILPVATFVLQSIEALTTYGKLLFCLRHDLPFHPRRGAALPTRFGIDALLGHARHAGIEVSDRDPVVERIAS
jgi:4-hydroxy-tetrahydrodipicolinate synthase